MHPAPVRSLLPETSEAEPVQRLPHPNDAQADATEPEKETNPTGSLNRLTPVSLFLETSCERVHRHFYCGFDVYA